MNTTLAMLALDVIPDASDIPAGDGPQPRPAPTTTGVRLDLHEQMGRLDAPELAPIGPDDLPASWSAAERRQALTLLWLAGYGPRPE